MNSLNVCLSFQVMGEDDIEDSKSHDFVRVSVAHPHLCSICDDYIVTPRCTARQCITCSCLFHAACVSKAGKCRRSAQNAPSSGSIVTSLSPDNEELFSESDITVGVVLADQVRFSFISFAIYITL